MKTPDLAILHLSDLHLGRSLGDSGSNDKAALKSLRSLGGLKIQAHDPYIVWDLANAVRAAARRVGVDDSSFDLVVVTGDISTNSEPQERFDFAVEFLTDTAGPATLRQPHLGISPDRLFCIPGNHDKLGETVGPERYSGSFGCFPEPVPYRRCVRTNGGRSVVIFGIDSNLYEEGNIAVGRITPETLSWLSEALEQEEREPQSITLLLLHHHPTDLNRFRRLSVRKFASRVFVKDLTRLEEGHRLLQLCEGRIDIVCHGHEHFPVVFRDAVSKALIVSAGTASQLTSTKKGHEPNSFHVITASGHSVTVTQFNWSGARFGADQQWTAELNSSDEPRLERLGGKPATYTDPVRRRQTMSAALHK